MVALVFLLGLGTVAGAATEVPGTRARFAWEPGSGPVEGFAVYVSRNRAGFPSFPEQTVDRPQATIQGERGETVQIRVTAFDAGGNESAPSPASAIVLFVEMPEPEEGEEEGEEEDPSDASPSGSRQHLIFSAGSGSRAFAEVGEAVVDHGGTRLRFAQSFSDPIVIVGPPTDHGAEPGVVRVENVTSEGFSVYFDEWPSLDGFHAKEVVSYLVVESGRHLMPDGSEWEAGRFSLAGGPARSRSFRRPFGGGFIVPLLTPQTRNGPPSAVRASDVTFHGFEAALFAEEASTQALPPEEIGYLAVHSKQRSGVLPASTRDLPYLVRWQDVDHEYTGILAHAIRYQEEQSADDEVAHAEERVGFLDLAGHVFAQDMTAAGPDAGSLRVRRPEHGAPIEWGTIPALTHDWQTIPLSGSYADPIVVVRGVSLEGGDPVIVRVANVRSDRFDVRLQEWLYSDGIHVPEQVSYMVAEAGAHHVGGLRFEAGKQEISTLGTAGTVRESFAVPFAGLPAVFSGVMTFRGPDPVASRAFGVDADDFALTMFEQEGRADGHATETVGWIALEQGSGVTRDDRLVTAFTVLADHQSRRVELGPVMAIKNPAIVASVASAHGNDPVEVRLPSRDASGLELFLEEEQFFDEETFHVFENVAIFAAD